MGEYDILLELTELRGRRVADVGCGRGELVRFLRAQGAEPVGVECGEGQLEAARNADPDHADSYLYGVGQDLPLPKTGAWTWSPSPSRCTTSPSAQMDQALAETYRVLMPGGQAFFMEPKAEGPSFELDRLVDDETEVRAKAQEALGRAATHGFEHVATRDYETEYAYADVEAFIAMMVGVDPGAQSNRCRSGQPHRRSLQPRRRSGRRRPVVCPAQQRGGAAPSVTPVQNVTQLRSSDLSTDSCENRAL